MDPTSEGSQRREGRKRLPSRPRQKEQPWTHEQKSWQRNNRMRRGRNARSAGSKQKQNDHASSRRSKRRGRQCRRATEGKNVPRKPPTGSADNGKCHRQIASKATRTKKWRDGCLLKSGRDHKDEHKAIHSGLCQGKAKLEI